MCRRVVALAVAYALALAPVLPLLAAFASAAELSPAGIGEICATKQSGARSAVDVPNGHGPVCPLGAGCAMQDCGAGGVLAAGADTVTVVALRSAPLLVHPADEALLLREGGAHLARAPPRV